MPRERTRIEIVMPAGKSVSDKQISGFAAAADLILRKRYIPDLGQVVVSNFAKAYTFPAETDNVYRSTESPADVGKMTRVTVFSPVHYTSLEGWMAIAKDLTETIQTAFGIPQDTVEMFTIEKSDSPRYIGGKWKCHLS